MLVKKYQFKKIICGKYDIERTLNNYGELGYRVISFREEKDGMCFAYMEREYEYEIPDIQEPEAPDQIITGLCY